MPDFHFETGFYNQNPLKSVSDYQLEDDKRKLNALLISGQTSDLQDKQRARAEEDRIRSALSQLGPTASTAERAGVLRSTGSLSAIKLAGEMEEKEAQAGQHRAQTANYTADAKSKEIANARTLLEHGMSALERAATPEQAQQELMSGIGKFWDEATAQKEIASLPRDPGEYQKWRRELYGQFLAAKDKMPKIENFSAGDRNITQAIDPRTGQPTVTGVVPIGQSPDNRATNARMAAEGAANRGNSMAIAQMTDTRARETNAIASAESGGTTNPILGVPVPTARPWDNQTNQRDANKVKSAEMTRGAKEVEKDEDAARKAASTAQDVKRFLELNKSTKTGTALDKIGLARSAKSLGAEYAEMEAITAKLSPQNKPEGAGATSDYDAKQFERATVGVDKPRQTNESIGTAMIKRAEQSQDYADYRATYLEQNGTLQGADRHWKQYVNDNPIFDASKSGSFALNKSRKDWRTYFAGNKPAEKQAKPSGGVIDFGSLK